MKAIKKALKGAVNDIGKAEDSLKEMEASIERLKQPTTRKKPGQNTANRPNITVKPRLKHLTDTSVTGKNAYSK